MKEFDKHQAAVSSLAFTADGRYMASGGRDQAICVYDMRKLQQRQTILAFEPVDAVALLPHGGSKGLVAVSGGTEGTLRTWDAHTGGRLAEHSQDGAGHPPLAAVDGLHYLPAAGLLLATTGEQNLVEYSAAEDESLEVVRVLAGFSDEIADMRFCKARDGGRRHLAVATNSSAVRIFDVADREGDGAGDSDGGCQFLSGHGGVILCVDVTPDGCFLATASKDHTARIWDLRSLACVYECSGHTGA